MNKNGPIIIIEDDEDDQEVLTEIFKSLNTTNELRFFETGTLALKYLDEPDIFPFLILSDVNLPEISGFDLRRQVFENKRMAEKCIPYLFFTTAASQQSVADAYSLSVQGFFVKPHTIEELKETITSIINYWSRCYSPNHYRAAAISKT
jgi:CheY-like chemotaxis protein